MPIKSCRTKIAFDGKTRAAFVLFLVTTLTATHAKKVPQSKSSPTSTTMPALANAAVSGEKIIRSIIIRGNKYIKQEVILKKLPYKVGLAFDPDKSAEAINALDALDHFDQIELAKEDIDHKTIDLYVFVVENKLFGKAIFKGNRHLTTKKLLEKLNIAKVETISEHFIQKSIRALEKYYREEGYPHVKISGQIAVNKENPDKADAVFTIEEGTKARVTRVNFVGNNNLPAWKLRDILFTREHWILHFINGAGQYNEEMLAMDKYRIEQLYRDHGYLMAKVTDTKVTFTDNNREIHVVFTVEEGAQFTVRKLSAPGDDIFLEKDLLPHVLLTVGKPYSHTKMVQSIERLRTLWGEKGYINAEVYPQVTPDETTHNVDITFYAERGKQVYVRRIDVTGNEVTQDKVIRRKIDIEEGDLLTTKKLERSQDSVEALSFFEPGGANWKMHRLSDTLVDLEMNVKEAKTGHLNFQVSYGSTEHSNKRAWKGQITLEQENFMGQGIDIGLRTQLQLSKRGSQIFEGHIADPHLFDTNIAGRLTGYHTKQTYDEWHNVTVTPSLKESGGSVAIGFFLPQIDKLLQLEIEAGMEHIESNTFKAREQSRESQTKILQTIIDNSFKTNPLQWFGISLIKDTRNHHIYPNKGYKVFLANKLVIPFLNDHYGFIKSELDGSYYTPLIAPDKLVLMLHGKVGVVHELGSGKHIPYKDLFHMGGQTTVRGFRFGEIGPAWKLEDPLGSRYAVQVNAELIFPIIPDYSMKGHFFYDAGAGWNTPKKGLSSHSGITRDQFNLRHAVGFGFNLVKPYPAKIDWGYKLDRNKKAGESPHEFHLSMNLAW